MWRRVLQVSADCSLYRLPTVNIDAAPKIVALRQSVSNTLAMAVTDDLTGLYNRRYFDRHLAIMLDRAQAQARASANPEFIRRKCLAIGCRPVDCDHEVGRF